MLLSNHSVEVVEDKRGPLMSLEAQSSNRASCKTRLDRHPAYPYLDELGLTLSNWIEGRGRHLAVPITSYAPMVFHGSEPWGIIALDHAAVEAGLRNFGKNGLMSHPRYGTLIRLGAVITSADMPGDPKLEASPCAENCSSCLKACPSKAFGEDGSFKKMTCLAKTIKHAIYPLAFQTPEGMRQIERVTNTAGSNYWLACDTCLKVCPNNRGNEEAKKYLEAVPSDRRALYSECVES